MTYADLGRKIALARLPFSPLLLIYLLNGDFGLVDHN